MVAVVVGAVGFLLPIGAASAADVQGERFVWHSGVTGDFSNPANWLLDGLVPDHAPGLGDQAYVGSATITIDDPLTVTSLIIDGSSVQVDAPITAGTIQFWSSQVSVDAALSPDNLTLQSATVDLGAPVSVGAAPNSTGFATSIAVANSHITGAGEISNTAPVSLTVNGANPTTIDAPLELDDASLRPSSPSGGFVEGAIVSTGDTTLAADVAAGTDVSVEADGSGHGTLAWTSDVANLDGSVAVADGVTAALPTTLNVNGELSLDGDAVATGGSVAMSASAALSLQAFDEPDDAAPLSLTGTLTMAAGADVTTTGSFSPCVGSEDILVHAAGGVTGAQAPFTEDEFPAWLSADAVPLRFDLVAVARRAQAGGGESCVGPDASERVARSLYRELLTRVADDGGADYWAGRLDGGTSAASAANALINTTEGRAAITRQVYRFYTCQGDNQPTQDQINLWSSYMAQSGSLDSIRADVMAHSVGTMDPVDCLYLHALGRAADPSGRAYIEDQLQTQSLEDVANGLIRTTEARRLQVTRIYLLLLGRFPDTAARDFWVSQLQDGKTEAYLATRVFGSTEHTNRNTV